MLGYFKELSEKDGPGAAKYLKGIDVIAPLFESDALSTGYRPPQDVEVTDVVSGAPPGITEQKNREYASVTVTYTVGEAPTTELFVLDRMNGVGWKFAAIRSSLPIGPWSPIRRSRS